MFEPMRSGIAHAASNITRSGTKTMALGAIHQGFRSRSGKKRAVPGRKETDVPPVSGITDSTTPSVESSGFSGLFVSSMAHPVRSGATLRPRSHHPPEESCRRGFVGILLAAKLAEFRWSCLGG